MAVISFTNYKREAECRMYRNCDAVHHAEQEN